MGSFDIVTMIVIPLLAAIIPAVISFYSARHQAKKALDIEIEKIKEQQKAEVEKIKVQQEAEMKKLKAQQDVELQKSALEIEKMKIEMEKQAEIYEKNAQTDVVKNIFGQLLTGNTSGFENVAAAVEKIEKLEQQVKQKKSNQHPARRKR